MWGKLRAQVRDQALNLFRRALGHERGRAALLDELRVLKHQENGLLIGARSAAPPYGDLGIATPTHGIEGLKDVTIVTGRFRSGTTLLWNIFRHCEGCTAYYEPFNERRWFDANRRGARVDATHLGVEDYWREYEGLQSLDADFDEQWTHRRLLMGERAWNPRMKRYVDALIQHASGRAVLKFNRLDFRLPWVRANYPSAKIVHICRHPREQWRSTFLRTTPHPPSAGMAGFASCDEFYVLSWARDLRYHFPFLDERECEHPYQMFYYLWKLSYLFGTKYSHVSLRLEDLVANPRRELERMFAAIDLAPRDMDALCGLCAQPRAGRWREYATDEWFAGHESHCEAVLEEFLR